MTDEQPTPESDSAIADAPSESRRQRLATRRRRRTRVAVTIVAIVAVSAVAVASAIALTDNKPARGATSNTTNPKFGAIANPPQLNKINTAHPVRALSHLDPLRLWIGGDSLAGSFGPTLGDMLGKTGIVKTNVDYKVSSGLWSNDIRDWQERAQEQMASDNPEAVVFIIGTNDTPVVNDVDRNNDGVPDWEVDYRRKVDDMMNTFVGNGAQPRTVFWLGAPTLGTKSMDRGAAAIDALVSEEALKRGSNVIFVDTYRMFSDSSGGYSRDIVDENGKTIEARISDGVHFTADGAAYLARAIYALLDARWHITKQADPSEPLHWSLAYGSGESVPGYHYSGSGSSQQSQSTSSTAEASTTLAPTTVASTTTVPATTPSTTSVAATTTPATEGKTTTSKP